MKISDLKNVPNNELLELFALYTRVEHYDPIATPSEIVALREEGISKEDVSAIILDRMSENGE